jgi:hypothetical protein
VLVSGAQVLVERERFCDGYVLWLGPNSRAAMQQQPQESGQTPRRSSTSSAPPTRHVL